MQRGANGLRAVDQGFHLHRGRQHRFEAGQGGLNAVDGFNNVGAGLAENHQIHTGAISGPGLHVGIFRTVDDIGDIAQVKRGYEDPKNFEIRNDGEQALMLGVVMKPGFNGLALGEALKPDYKLYMQRVTPRNGPAYLLIDHKGDGTFTRQDNTLDNGVRVPQWVLLRF